MQAGVIRRSDAVNDGDLAFMVKACNKQGREFARDWGLPFDPLAFYARQDGLPDDGVRIISIVDNLSMKGVIGYHDAFAGRVASQVLGQGVGTSVTLGHEYLEMKADPFCNIWRTMLSGGKSTALEVCDALQADSYIEEVELVEERRPITLPNYLLPSWFDPFGKFPFDRMRKLTEPFTMTPGGYMILRDQDNLISNVFASGMPPEMLTKLQNPLSRTLARLSGRTLP